MATTDCVVVTVGKYGITLDQYEAILTERNNGLGRFQDSPDLLHAAANYLERS